MLVSKKEVLVLKLSTADEVIATVTSHTADAYTVENPFVLIMTQQGAQFSPFMIMSDMEEPIEIRCVNIVATAKPTKNMLAGYEKSTSKIVLPTKSGIIV